MLPSSFIALEAGGEFVLFSSGLDPVKHLSEIITPATGNIELMRVIAVFV